MIRIGNTTVLAAGIVLAAALFPGFAGASAGAETMLLPPAALASETYADVVDLTDAAPLIVRVELRKLTAAPVSSPAPAPTGAVRATARYYVEARVISALAGQAAAGDPVQYLVNLPLDSRGKPPKLKKREMLLFARPARGAPGDIQLVAPDAQREWSEALGARVSAALRELHAPDAPPRITGLREAIHVPGNLAGEGETQIFLETANHSAAAITVTHLPGQPTEWGVSFSEVVAAAASAPPAETLAWYRLACFLPESLPGGANLSDGMQDKARAEADYRLVLRALGPCPRARAQ